MKLLYTLLFSFVSLISFAQSNQSMHFDGVDDYVATDSASYLIANKTALSLTGWFNPDELRYGAGMMGFRGLGSGPGGIYVLQLGNGALECRLVTSTGTYQPNCPAGTLTAGVWQHLAVVYDGTTIKAYLNGNLVNSAAASGVIGSMDSPFAIGKSLANGFNFVYPGKIDEVTLWSKALSQQEITDMQTNEPYGNEANLELYFKFDQGFPSGDNTSFRKVFSETGSSLDADIYNMTLDGNTSNFVGTLNAGIQGISFPQITTKVSTQAPFALEATSTSGLPVTFEMVSGPATISGTQMSLTGTPGMVTVKAKQAGNASFAPADDVYCTFEVVDPTVNVPNIDIRNPLQGDFYMTSFSPIELAAEINIDFAESFDVNEIYFYVDGEQVGIKDWGNEHYTAWWTPSAFGSHTFKVEAVNNYGGSTFKEVVFNITTNIQDMNLDAFNNLWLSVNNVSETVEAELPCFLGAFNDIAGTLHITCPSGGCDAWDMISSIEVQGHNGEWYQIIRYITPYGVACNHTIDLTDFMSLLQGKVRFRGNLGTQGNGFLYRLELDYTAGAPNYKYGKIDKLWSETYNFGNLSNLQPCETYNFEYETNTQASTLKLVSTGHGWGNNNTGNAAEFHEDTHHIWLNGAETFTQHNWVDCNPNPDGCSPQNGTWYYDRAGWCPGSIAQWFDYNMTPYISTSPVEMNYIFDTNYVDYCNASNPNCVSGTTCADCNDSYNPHLIVKSHIISFSNTPYNTDTTYQPTVGIKELKKNFTFSVYPNPTAGQFYVDISNLNDATKLLIRDIQGKVIAAQDIRNNQTPLFTDISGAPSGIYLVEVHTNDGFYMQKVVKR